MEKKLSLAQTIKALQSINGITNVVQRKGTSLVNFTYQWDGREIIGLADARDLLIELTAHPIKA